MPKADFPFLPNGFFFLGFENSFFSDREVEGLEDLDDDFDDDFEDDSEEDILNDELEDISKETDDVSKVSEKKHQN